MINGKSYLDTFKFGDYILVLCRDRHAWLGVVVGFTDHGLLLQPRYTYKPGRPGLEELWINRQHVIAIYGLQNENGEQITSYEDADWDEVYGVIQSWRAGEL